MCPRKSYSADASPLSKKGIGDIPLFFVSFCLSLRIPQKAVVSLTGCDPRTVKKYQDALRDGMCQTVDAEKRAGNLLLGGEVKYVEVDEAFVSKRKNGRGKRTAKEGLWVVGLTEVDPAAVEGMTPRKLDCLRRFEARREQQADSKLARAKKRRSIERREMTTGPPPSPSNPEPPIENDTNENEVEIIPIHHNGDGEDLDQFIADKRLKREIDTLFKRSRKFKSKKTLFFVVETRTKEVLFDIIRNNVQPKTTIFTDEWKGYFGLDDEGYIHKTVCHKRRFSRFEIDGTTVTRITTNHIERVWVELRKTMKHTDKDSFVKYINLETYHQLKLFHANNDLNFESILRDFGKNGF